MRAAGFIINHTNLSSIISIADSILDLSAEDGSILKDIPFVSMACSEQRADGGEKKRADEAERQLEIERKKHEEENKVLKKEIERLRAVAN